MLPGMAKRTCGLMNNGFLMTEGNVQRTAIYYGNGDIITVLVNRE